jgi:hypothetical protein
MAMINNLIQPMKKIYFITIGLYVCFLSYSQISLLRTNAGPSTYKSFSQNKKLNEKSSLQREWIILNDEKCPIQLRNDVGIQLTIQTTGFRFYATGTVVPTEPVAAYEVHHILYNVFGEHSTTLSNVDIADINAPTNMNDGNTWYAADNQVFEYLSCVSYVAIVKTNAGSIWRYNPLDIKQELNKIQIEYEEGYKPSSEPEKK